jgi:ribosomal-protein-alanine N-acetyltransferase
MVAEPTRIETPRLILRPWGEADRSGFAAMNADPEVRRYFPSVLSRPEADDFFDKLLGRQREGPTFAAVERKAGGLIGMAGLAEVKDEMPPAPAVEIGWRLIREAWGRGYATEAARGWLDHGFRTLDLGEIVAFTVPVNGRSRAVMERLGMTRDPAGDFDHPDLPVDSPLRRHVLYRLKREGWTP